MLNEKDRINKEREKECNIESGAKGGASRALHTENVSGVAVERNKNNDNAKWRGRGLANSTHR